MSIHHVGCEHNPTCDNYTKQQIGHESEGMNWFVDPSSEGIGGFIQEVKG